MRSFVIVFAIFAAGCIKSGGFACASDSACMRGGVQGTCESVGYCSFADERCASGKRYADLSGQYANQCVGDLGGPDGGHPDSGGGSGSHDAAVDAPPPMGCPATYAAISGIMGHVYRKLAIAAWTTQRDACAADGANAYLVIPDNDQELVAVHTLANANFWVGITDMVTEGTYVTVRGTAATYLPWASGQPDNSMNSDCVEALGSLEYDDKKCTATAVAVCECEP